VKPADEWAATRERLKREVEKIGPTRAADEIPVNRATLFRLVTGRVQRPSLPTRECVERFLDDREMGNDCP